MKQDSPTHKLLLSLLVHLSSTNQNESIKRQLAEKVEEEEVYTRQTAGASREYFPRAVEMHL
jgi:hypothetical protein